MSIHIEPVCPEVPSRADQREESMRRSIARFAASGRIACCLLGLAAAGAGALPAREVPPSWLEAWAPAPGVMLDLLGVRPAARPVRIQPSPAARRGAQPGAPGRRHAGRFVPLCGGEIGPNGCP